MKKQFIAYTVGSFLFSIIGSLLVYQNPGLMATLEVSPLNPPSNPAAYALSGLVLTLPIVVLQTGALWYFLSSLKSFRRNLRIAYYFLAAGLLLFGLGQVQLPLQLLLTALLPGALLVLPWLLSSIVLYVAIYRFASLLDRRPSWAGVWKVTTLGIATALFVAAMPHTPIAQSELKIDLLCGLIVFGGAFGLAATLLAWHIYRVIGGAYQPAIKMLSLALGFMTFSYYNMILSITAVPLIDPSGWYANYNLFLIPFALASALFLRAGQLFKQVGSQYGNLPETASNLNVLMHVIQMVSNPNEIDNVLDELRRLTALHQTNAPMTPAENDKLIAIYLQVEHHLTTKDRLRSPDQIELRLHLPAHFQNSLAAVKAV